MLASPIKMKALHKKINQVSDCGRQLVNNGTTDRNPMATLTTLRRHIVLRPECVRRGLEAGGWLGAPVADSMRGNGDWPKDTTLKPEGGFGFNAWRRGPPRSGRRPRARCRAT